MANKQSKITLQITERYSTYHAEQIVTNRFSHDSFINALNAFENMPQLSIATAGYSEEGRAIYNISFGKGKTRVLLWSQMHGNESTATRVILDLLNFLTADDEFNSFREKISEELTLQFIPMLNPDGAERFQRRTSTEIDINRDALEPQTPEAKILDAIVEQYKPDFGFNLHDQHRFYNVKGSGIPASISFLAPAYNPEREVNSSRKKAIQVVAGMSKLLQNYIPGGVALYDDTHSHRSFGDNIQAQGISTILIESGWLANDMEKEGIRKLNFTALLGAFEMIALDTLTNYFIIDYLEIPDIDTRFFDLLINNVKANSQSNSKVDIGIRRSEQLLTHPDYYSTGKIADIGDLSTYHYGFETIDAEGLTVVAGKTVNIESLEDVSIASVKRLLKQGVLYLITTDIPDENYFSLPINILHPRRRKSVHLPVFEGHANFLLVDTKQVIKYIIINGFLITPDNLDPSINGLVIA